MRAGRIRERVIFQRRAPGKNDFGEENGEWQDIATVWAGVEPIKGRELFAAQQTMSEVTTQIVCRYSSFLAGITAKDRILHGTTVYDIKAPPINVSSRRRELQFMCAQHSTT